MESAATKKPRQQKCPPQSLLPSTSHRHRTPLRNASAKANAGFNKCSFHNSSRSRFMICWMVSLQHSSHLSPGVSCLPQSLGSVASTWASDVSFQVADLGQNLSKIVSTNFSGPFLALRPLEILARDLRWRVGYVLLRPILLRPGST